MVVSLHIPTFGRVCVVLRCAASRSIALRRVVSTLAAVVYCVTLRRNVSSDEITLHFATLRCGESRLAALRCVVPSTATALCIVTLRCVVISTEVVLYSAALRRVRTSTAAALCPLRCNVLCRLLHSWDLRCVWGCGNVVSVQEGMRESKCRQPVRRMEGRH